MGEEGCVERGVERRVEGEVVERRHFGGNRRPNGPVHGGSLWPFTHDRVFR